MFNNGRYSAPGHILEHCFQYPSTLDHSLEPHLLLSLTSSLHGSNHHFSVSRAILVMSWKKSLTRPAGRTWCYHGVISVEMFKSSNNYSVTWEQVTRRGSLTNQSSSQKVSLDGSTESLLLNVNQLITAAGVKWRWWRILCCHLTRSSVHTAKDYAACLLSHF